MTTATHTEAEKRYLDRLRQLETCARLVVEAEAELNAEGIYSTPPNITTFTEYAENFAAILARNEFVTGEKVLTLVVNEVTSTLIAMYTVGGILVRGKRLPYVITDENFPKDAAHRAQIQAEVATANPGWRVIWRN